METGTPDIFNSKSLKGFAKSLLFIIGLFAVLSYGVAALVLHFGKNLDDTSFKLILILAGIPLISLLITFLIIIYRFNCFMELHYKKLDKLPDNESKNKDILIEKYKQRILDMKEIIETCLTMTKAIKPDSTKEDKETIKEVLVKSLERLSGKIKEEV